MIALKKIEKITEKVYSSTILTNIVGWVYISIIFYIDTLSGEDVRLGFLYQLVVIFFAWKFKIRYLIFVSLVCSVLRVFSVNISGGSYPSLFLPIFNSLARFTAFFITAFIVCHLKKVILTQKILNQKLTLANEEILRLAQVKSEFTSVVSHELRTPLTVIKEGIGIVQDGSAGVINPNQKKYLDLAKNNVDRLTRLINDVLDFQKMSSPQAEIHMTSHSINKLLIEVKETFLVIARNKGLELAVDLEEGLQNLPFDHDKLTQVLTNLLGNAIKATEKGSITIRSKQLGNVVRISVEDQGPGIKNEDIPKLFQAFSQLTAGSERKTGGTGLGLAISKQIIEKHHGKIGVESVFGRGATFYFLLPIEERRNRQGR